MLGVFYPAHPGIKCWRHSLDAPVRPPAAARDYTQAGFHGRSHPWTGSSSSRPLLCPARHGAGHPVWPPAKDHGQFVTHAHIMLVGFVVSFIVCLLPAGRQSGRLVSN